MIKIMTKCGSIEIFYIVGGKLLFFILYAICIIVLNSFYSYYAVYAILSSPLFIINTSFYGLTNLTLIVLLIIFIIKAIKKKK